MGTSDILTLIGLVMGGVASLCGTIGWFHIYMNSQKEQARAELAEAIKGEADARAKDIERVENQVKATNDLALSVALMGKSIEHLTERFTESQGAILDVKKALSSIDSRINQMALDAAKRAPRARTPRKAPPHDRVKTSD